ncbi:type II toxin-antitoxin system death-on-curing family toxin [Enterococcus columbae]|uniref:Fido domain-containing protein n=1 Tax=Enterococcus columbae DSM 7374 = ATCC 51263 TaxID=1121865 RepID=S1N466_9ENTE|nr:type II toxin-antitoxin system death-on-curing family toxin [Enterococcus columbae]EOT38105.1 hypothetical protein OMW_02363 [Enterococcus columbae DSM 7374 = ATCC 51263]EOW83772.1 hypothetical protein I568_01574 [Enterococcus columbae DSM 7374 = ATCC 51263]
MTKYLTEKQVVLSNQRVIEHYSPLEHSRLVSSSALNMIANLPEQYVFGKELYPTLIEKAAVIFVHLVKKHAFENANKRTAVFVLIAFLKLNHVKLVVRTQELVDFTVLVAVNPLTDESFKGYCEWLNERTEPL